MLEKLGSMTLAGNDPQRLVFFFGVVLLSLAAGRLAGFFLLRAGKSKRAQSREWLCIGLHALAKPMTLLFGAFGLWLVLVADVLEMGPGLRMVLGTVSQVLNAVAIGFAVYSLVAIVDHYLLRFSQRTQSKVDDILAPLVGKSIRIMVAVLVVLNVATVVSGKSVMTIVAGLGVGGIAVALAAQDSIKNFFGSLVILGDRPFEVGDRVVIEGHDGPVESVGFRSTRLRTLDGHLVTIPNADVANKMVRNISKRPYIKRVATISITYDTPPRKVARAVEILKEILSGHDGMDEELPPRVFFSEFAACSLDIMVIYWYHPPEYWDYLAFSERVNMQILNRFNDEGIEFAFPTQTIHLQNQSGVRP